MLPPQTDSQMHAHACAHAHTHAYNFSEKRQQDSCFWFGALLSYPLFTSFISFPPCFCAPISADLVSSKLLPDHPPARGYRRLPKSRKKRCVINAGKIKHLEHVHLLSPFLFLSIFGGGCGGGHLGLNCLSTNALYVFCGHF